MIAEARDEHGADLVLFPELALCGYPPEDLLLRPASWPPASGAGDALDPRR
jgi:predicted amidohydrolase